MSPAVRCICLLLIAVVSACGSGSEEKTSEAQTKAATVPDTAGVPAPRPRPQPVPVPVPEPEVIPSRDPDFTGVFSDSLANYLVEFLPDTAGLQYIRENVLVRVDVTDLQLARFKQQEQEETLQVVMDDGSYYMYELESTMEKLGVKVVQAKERYLGFLGINSDFQFLIDLDKDSLPGLQWTFIAFNTTREPKLIDNLFDIEHEKLAHYINKDVYPAILLEDTVLWNLPTRLAALDSISDADFWQFLKDYREAALALSGENLWYHPEYEYYDGGIFRYDEPKYPLAIILRREVRKLGYEFMNYQGESYFSQSPPFVRRHLYPKASDTMRQFLDIFLLSYTIDYWDEGSLMVAPIEIAQHIVLWERFAQNHPDFVAPDYATTEAADLVSYLIDEGVDYEPYFSEEDSTLQPRFIRSFEHLIKEAPETTSGRRIGEYYRLLEANEFKKTDTVANYLKAYWEERRALRD